ncbi:hypothetical protein [Streptomyces sp. NPDC058718]|uniref:hypothetical protein n=1 Tax=Streptomyces sp. NPDC058718 TaxID=3346610 RepID=UPI00369AB197
MTNQLTLGLAGEMALPQPGVREGTAWWAGRQATSDYYAQTPQQIDDAWTPERIARTWSQCPVSERYVLDLADTHPPVPEDD